MMGYCFLIEKLLCMVKVYGTKALHNSNLRVNDTISMIVSLNLYCNSFMVYCRYYRVAEKTC